MTLHPQWVKVVPMAWIYLLIAGLFEVGWPLGLKLSQTPERRVAGISAAIVAMALSGCFLWLAQRSITIGTAYAVWTGIGVVGTYAIGVLFFGDPAGMGRMLAVGLILAGIAGLKLADAGH